MTNKPNLPAKSTSRGIQKAHTRIVPTSRGYKPIIINPNIRKDMVPRVRPMVPAAKVPITTTTMQAQVKLPPKERPEEPHTPVRLPPKERSPEPSRIQWWKTKERFREYIEVSGKYENIMGALEEDVTPNNIERFWEDVWDKFGEQTNERDAKAALKVLDKIVGGLDDSGVSLIQEISWEGQEFVTLVSVPMPGQVNDEDEYLDVHRWNNRGDIIGENEYGRAAGDGRDYVHLVIKNNQISDQSWFQIPEDDLISRELHGSGYVEKQVEEDVETVHMLKDLNKKIGPIYVLFPHAEYREGLWVAVPREKEKEAREFLKGRLEREQAYDDY